MTNVADPTMRSSDTSMESVVLQSSAIKSELYQHHPASSVIHEIDEIENNIHGNHQSIQQIDSSDIPTNTEEEYDPAMQSNVPFYKQLLNRMNPMECLGTSDNMISKASQTTVSAVQGCTTTAYKSCFADDREEFEFILQGILSQIVISKTAIVAKSKSRTAALQRLYRLTDREHSHNRVPAVCTTSFTTIEILVHCLQETIPVNDRRQAILIVNNLCIPIENKAAIVFGEPFEPLMDIILSLIRVRSTESYLALVALLNLSYIQDNRAKTLIFNYVSKSDEVASQYSYQLPSDNPLSTLRILEELLVEYVPFTYNPKIINSIEQQCCRWSMNVIRSLICTIPSHVMTIGKNSKIPLLAIRCLSKADTSNLTLWTRDSLEDACFMILIHICGIDDCVRVLKNDAGAINELVAVCDQLRNTNPIGGIHQFRANALLDRLDDFHSSQSIGYSV